MTNFPRVWAQLSSTLGSLRSVFAQKKEVQDGLSAFVLYLITPILEKVGWEVKPEEGPLEGQLRALIISLAGSVGHQE